MATHVLTDAALWAGPVAVHGLANSLQFATSREVKDSTVFGGSARTNRVGLMAVQITAAGYADYDTYDADLRSLFAGKATTQVSLAPTATEGGVAYTCRALTTGLNPLGASIGEMNAVQVTAGGRGGTAPVRGTLMHAAAARTETGTGTARQLGAVEAGETVYASLHVLAASGTSPTLDVVVASDNAEAFSSSTTQLTFTQQTGKGTDWKSKAGAITDDWWRVAWTIGGTDPSFTFVVVVGIESTAA